jgi:hypothetical protein
VFRSTVGLSRHLDSWDLGSAKRIFSCGLVGEGTLAEKRFQVFVSSTYEDLKSERERVLRTLAESNYIAAGMEFFPAIDEEQFNFIKTVIDDSDYYVAIIAGKYGTVALDGLSYSEKEYTYAVQNSIPVIALIRENITSLDASKRENEAEKSKKLELFRERVSTGRLVSYWKDETELCYRLINSLATTIKKYPGDGWIRGGLESPEELLRKILTLEEENKALQKTITERQEAPLAARVTELLSHDIELTYNYNEGVDSSVREGVASLSIVKIAEFLIPRLREEISAEKFESLIAELIMKFSGNAVLSVETSSIDALSSMFSSFGLISVTFDIRDRKRFIRTALGRGVVGSEVLEAFEKEQRKGVLERSSERNVTVLQLLEDLVFLIWKGTTFLIGKLAGWKNASRD